ncbi:MAG: hypothetical protein R2813_07180 [Flavobacteriales bacterium]
MNDANISKAIEAFNQAHQIDSTKVETYYGMALALTQICSKEGESCIEAIALFNQSIGMDSTYGTPYYNRAVCKNQLLDYSGALDDINKEISRTPNQAYFYYNRAFIYMQLKQKSDACSDLKKSCELGYKESCQKNQSFCGSSNP